MPVALKVKSRLLHKTRLSAGVFTLWTFDFYLIFTIPSSTFIEVGVIFVEDAGFFIHIILSEKPTKLACHFFFKAGIVLGRSRVDGACPFRDYWPS